MAGFLLAPENIVFVSALLLIASAEPRLALPMLLWIVGYIGFLRDFVPRMRDLSRLSAEARSQVMGRVVDSYTNFPTVKLFARAAELDVLVREHGVELRQLPDDVLLALRRASDKVLEEAAAADPLARRALGLLLAGMALERERGDRLLQRAHRLGARHAPDLHSEHRGVGRDIAR